MVTSCSALKCTNRWNKESGLTFHRFPLKNEELMKKWVAAMKREGFNPTRSSFLCGNHFREADYLVRPGTTRKHLKPDAVPSLFDFTALRKQTRRRVRILRENCAATLQCPTGGAQNVPEQLLLDEIQIKEEPLPPENDDYDYRSEVDSQRCKSYGTKMADMEMGPLVNVKRETDPLDFEEQTEIHLPETHHVWLQDVKLESVKQEPESESEDSESNYSIGDSPLAFPIKEENKANDLGGICSSSQLRNNSDEDFPPEYLSLYDKVKVEITEGHISPTIEQNILSDNTGFASPDGVSPDGVNADGINTNSGHLSDLGQSELQQWKSTVRQCDRFSCRDCGDNFTKPEDLSSHRRKRDDPITCELCDKNFKSECVLATHIRIHTGERPFQCKICGKTFLRISYLLKHRRKRHGCIQPGIPCQICGKVFANFGLLSAHSRSHYNVEPNFVSCEQCGKEFRRTKYLNRHKRCTHNVEKLRCELCGEVQETRTALISHVVKHTGALPFNCADCDQAFSSTLQLARHSRIHKGELPFPCSDCELSFMTGEQLRSHKRYHTGERPFCCVFCGRAFKNEPDLIVHVHSHTDP